MGEVVNLGEDVADKSGGSELEVEKGFVVCYGGYVVIWLELVEHVSLEFRGEKAYIYEKFIDVLHDMDDDRQVYFQQHFLSVQK